MAGGLTYNFVGFVRIDMGNSVFKPGGVPKFNACINWQPDSMAMYVEGYKLAADTLLDNVLNTGANQDKLVLPICLQYRHWLELYLKQMIGISRRVLERSQKSYEHHNLEKLWHAHNGLMNDVIKDFDPSIRQYITKQNVNCIRIIIEDFMEVDPESTAFRYPKDINGNRSLEGIKNISLTILKDRMNELAKLLEKYETCLYQIIDWQFDSMP